MHSPFAFAAFPSWKRVFEDKSRAAQKKAVYADPAFRNQFREDLQATRWAFGNWERITLHEVRSPELKRLRGQDRRRRSAAPKARIGVDALLDLTLADDLELEFTMASYNTRVDRMAELLNNPSDPHRPRRRRRARRHAVRLGLPDLPARHLGARSRRASRFPRRCAG